MTALTRNSQSALVPDPYSMGTTLPQISESNPPSLPWAGGLSAPEPAVPTGSVRGLFPYLGRPFNGSASRRTTGEHSRTSPRAQLRRLGRLLERVVKGRLPDDRLSQLRQPKELGTRTTCSGLVPYLPATKSAPASWRHCRSYRHALYRCSMDPLTRKGVPDE